jgi:nucleotide-binding universal stress UspA family protein
MTETIAAPFESAPATVADPGTGPTIVAVGGIDPASVLRAARMLEPRVGGGILAVSVVEPPPTSIGGADPRFVPPNYIDRLRDEAAEVLSQKLLAAGGSAIGWRSKIVVGEPAFTLADLAESAQAALLVMGIGRHRALDRVFGSETTLRAIRVAPCPVLVVHPDLDGPFHDVVVAVDFSPASAYAAQLALPLLGPQATLHLVHVWRPEQTDDAEVAIANERYVQSLDRRFERFTELLDRPDGVEVKTIVREGKAAERVLDYASAHHADLIVAGRHGLNPLQRLLVGSQTTELLRRAGRSLLIAPEPPFPARDRLMLHLTGTSRSSEPDEWQTQLDAFTERNHGRHLVLDTEDLVFGSRVIESGLELVRATCHPEVRRIELTVGDPDRPAHRITRVIGTIQSVKIAADESGNDWALHVHHGGGRTTLTFTDAAKTS